MQNVIPLPHNLDFTGDKAAAMSLAQGIHNFYLSRGYTNILVEIVPRILTNSQGDRVAVHWDIRSNLRFRVADAKERRIFE